jgi:NADP-reducing hydrogenase subunit HndD
LPPPASQLPERPQQAEAAVVSATIDGRPVEAPAGATILDACRDAGIEVPTLCYLETLTPVNACRVCVVEVEGARVLAPACSRRLEPGMAIRTRSPRVDLSRKLVLELLASSVDLSTAPTLEPMMREYGADPGRFARAAGAIAPQAAALSAASVSSAAPSVSAASVSSAAPSGSAASVSSAAPSVSAASVSSAAPSGFAPPVSSAAPSVSVASVSQPVKIDNDLYVRDYSKCVLCYKCVEACGTDAQHTFAIAVAGRGFDAHISTEFDVVLPESACVYCGNCIAVCPTGALMARHEYDLRQAGQWRPDEQTVTDTTCPYCGVGCTLSVHVQDQKIVKVMSPLESDVTHGNLCVKGRFGFEYVNKTP